MRVLLMVMFVLRGACGVPCDTCPAGQMIAMACTDTSNSVCASCPAYTFSFGPSSTECVSASTCAAGSYYVSADAGCQTCPTGSYCPNVKSVIACSAGYSCPAGSTAPVACPVSGYACPLGTGYAIACAVCGAGQYLRSQCTLSSNTVCGGCPTGLYCRGLCLYFCSYPIGFAIDSTPQAERRCPRPARRSVNLASMNRQLVRPRRTGCALTVFWVRTSV